MEENSLNFLQRNVKEEPPVEFVLILPRPTSTWVSFMEKRKWVRSVQLMKFDAKWREEATLFQTFFTCEHCQLVAKRKVSLAYHLEACSKRYPDRFKCDLCGRAFQKKSLVRPHMLKHSTELKFWCDKCDQGFKSEKNLLLHSRANKIHKCIPYIFVQTSAESSSR